MPHTSKHRAIDYIASMAEIDKETASKAYNAFLAFAVQSLKKNESVYLPDFGVFTVEKRNARTVRLPNGTVVKVRSKKVAKFNAYKHLRDAVN
jgi:nucleoid DNA-binding protein